MSSDIVNCEFLLAFQLESTDGVTVIVYATTTAPLLAQLPADNGGCGFNMGMACILLLIY